MRQPTAPLLQSLREQALQLSEHHQLPLHTRHYILNNLEETVRPGVMRAARLRRLSDGQIILLTAEYEDTPRKAWTLKLYAIQLARPDRFGWLAAVETTCNSRVLKIEDVSLRANYQNKGLGTWLLTTLFEFNLTEAFDSITGELIKKDFDHVHLLEHWYTKHGFTVTLVQAKRQGSIVKMLQPQEK